ncbi:hypothetical protein NUITMVA1_35460 [Aeromonas hydrophila]|nr:hypothetical protein NUITMVA1_35460 [Aeromonas hydrophila]
MGVYYAAIGCAPALLVHDDLHVGDEFAGGLVVVQATASPQDMVTPGLVIDPQDAACELRAAQLSNAFPRALDEEDMTGAVGREGAFPPTMDRGQWGYWLRSAGAGPKMSVRSTEMLPPLRSAHSRCHK